MNRWILLTCVLGLTALLSAHDRAAALQEKGGSPAKQTVQYARDIQPILSANCFTCHGPDAKSRKAGLRLDLAEEATKSLRSGLRAIVPGDVKASELVARIDSHEKSERMPPLKTQKTLKDREKELLETLDRRRGGLSETLGLRAAAACRRCRRQSGLDGSASRSTASSWPGSRRKGLFPPPEADRYTLARRVALDLTGLPPTLEAVDRFVADKSPDAYEKFVDQMLAVAGLWRTLGPGLARPGPLRRFQRLRGGSAAHDLEVPRLGHPGHQQEPAVRPLHRGADRRRHAAAIRRRTRSSPPLSIATR